MAPEVSRIKTAKGQEPFPQLRRQRPVVAQSQNRKSLNLGERFAKNSNKPNTKCQNSLDIS
jgi:hypothetical protein